MSRADTRAAEDKTLKPFKFYGSSLPRPRFYTNVKYNDHRVDPPLSVMDPLMSWAHDAHWSMGGVNFTRHRLQGKIEGNVEKLRAQLEKQSDVKSPKIKKSVDAGEKGKKGSRVRVNDTPSPPPAPVAIKRRRVVGLVDEEDVDVDEEEIGGKRRLVRKLGDDFERVARESGMATRSKRNEAGDGEVRKRVKKLVKVGEIRSSPRLAKNGGGK